MTSDRSRIVSHIVHAALARQGADRDAFITEACQIDPSLKTEVDAVLASHAAESIAGEEPPPEHDESPFPPETGGADLDAAVGFHHERTSPASIAPSVVAARTHDKPAPSLVLTIAWMVIASAAIVIAVTSWVIWFR